MVYQLSITLMREQTQISRLSTVQAPFVCPFGGGGREGLDEKKNLVSYSCDILCRGAYSSDGWSIICSGKWWICREQVDSGQWGWVQPIWGWSI